MGIHRLDQSILGQGQVAGSCECSNEPFVSIKCSLASVSVSGRTLLHGVS
jgi:hypothetical protein